ncbi:MAG TPA: SDR family oxidoreductase [Chitinophagaceae bacterium]|nr:SDR family oxidoreductase [Chitinophagaceae bacterium]
MELQLKDKVILVTGGAKGIGRAICETLAREGAIPVIAGRNAADNRAAEQAIRSQGHQVLSLEAELTLPEDCAKTVDQAVHALGRLDGLVNNAGVNDGVGLENGSYGAFMASLHKNLVHYYLMAHHALPHLIRAKGSIVNISSKTAETGQGNTSAYAAANGGRNALTREWAVELLKYGIRVNAVVVSECWTPLYESWIGTFADPDRKLQSIAKKIPLEHRLTSPVEIADMVAFLLSSCSSHTTGQLIHVDGGYVHLDRALTD